MKTAPCILPALALALVLALCLGSATAWAQRDMEESSDYLLPDTARQLSQKRPTLGQVTKRAQAGDPVAQNRMGEYYLKGIEVPQHFTLARQWYLRAAQQGYAPSMAAVARLYAEGKGGLKDLGQAYFWYSLAAARGIRAAASRRDGLVPELTSSQLKQLQDQALAWKPRPERGAKP